MNRHVARLFPVGGDLHDPDELAPVFNGWKHGPPIRPRAAELDELSAGAANEVSNSERSEQRREQQQR